MHTRTIPPIYLGIFLMIMSFFACTEPQQTEEPPKETPAPLVYRLYVGTASGDTAQGIYALNFFEETGDFELLHVTPVATNPAFLTYAADRQYIYCVHGVKGQAQGGVSAYKITPKSGELVKLNQVSSGGQGPCYISAHPDGGWIWVANYSSGTVAAFPIQEDGSLGEASGVVQHEGSSINPDRQEGPHAHYVRQGIGGLIYAADLGMDKVMLYEFDETAGTLNTPSTAYLELEPGSGPRHIDYHPNGEFVYVMNELQGSVSVFRFDEAYNSFERIQTISSLPAGFDGYNKSADIHVHPTGRFLYASNRGDHDSIAVFEIDETNGSLSLVEIQHEGIAWPRNFAIDPGGKYVLVANRNTDDIVSFSIDAETGALSPTGHQVTIPKPMCIQF